MKVDEYIRREKKLINESIELWVKSEIKTKVFEAGQYTIWPEGHRYRSIVGLEIYRALRGKQSKFLKGVVGIECLHHASLVFDDLPCMDNSPMRKAKPTTHLQYGEDIAILAGLYLWDRGRQLLYENTREHLSDPEEIDEVEFLIHETIVGMLIGQEIDLKTNKTDSELSQSIYQKNRMFHLACVLPAYVLQKKQYLDLLNNIGVDLAVAYQLFDDLRDIEGDSKIIGKPIQVDKGTSVYRYGVESVKQQLAERKQRIIGNIQKIQTSSRLKRMIEHILTTPS